MKKKIDSEGDEFYVGYFPQAPERTASLVQKVIIGIGILVLIIPLLLVLNQKPFSSATFEYGKLSVLEGQLFKGPVPHLKVIAGKEATQTILLVGFGKAGADKTLTKFEEKLGSLDGKSIRVSGNLIYGNGKSLMQLDENVLPVILETLNNEVQSSLIPLGDVSLSGEIVDPKCFFGVMKPAEGKPHRSCAIRCITGGIPPVFHADEVDDVVLLGEDFQPVNQQVLSIVGDHVELSGQLVQFDNWKILLIKRERLASISNAVQQARNLLAMEQGMTLCQSN